MITVASYIFWISLLVLFYTYIGYGILIYMINLFKRENRNADIDETEWPRLTLLVAAYNEEDFILKKIINSLNLDYPREKLDLWFVTDGSTDDTKNIVSGFPNIQLFHQDQRRGKIHAVNRMMKLIKTPIVVFSDANTILNHDALKNLVVHYKDPKVGGVSGEKKIVDKDADNASGSGEGIYWKYESFLKKMDSKLYSIVGSAGELFSVRTDLFQPPPENMVIEDFYISMKIASKGYRFIYEPKAMATETASASVLDEWKRKVRISAGGIQAIIKLYPLLNIFKYKTLSFQYISHRVFRWTLAPMALLTTFGANVILYQTGHWIYHASMYTQIIFYLLALIGYSFRNKTISIKGFFVPFYFLMMNLSVYVGFVRFIRKKQAVTWEKTKRAMA